MRGMCMKRQLCMMLGLAMVLLAGCCLLSSPYDYMENWLIREDAVRSFSIPADVFYLQSDLYANVESLPLMSAYAKAEVGGGRFAGLARVFAPLIVSEGDLDRALDWYFRYHHERKRPFFFIGEGKGGALLKAYEEKNANFLKAAGLLKSFYTDEARKGFVTSDMVKEIKASITRARFKAIWGREMSQMMPKE